MSASGLEKATGGGLHPALYIASWIFFSNSTILFNKWILDNKDTPFKYPVILTCWHMIFSTVATQVLARTTTMLDGRKEVKMTGRVYLRSVVPIGLLYSGSLVCSNMVYMYLSVSFIQMLKAAAPVAVLLCSWAWRLKEPSAKTFANVCVIVLGVMIASLGEISFSWMGVFYQLGGIIFEALRLTMIEVMLAGDSEQKKMDPLVSLYYYAPVCAVTNVFVALIVEARTFQVEDLISVGIVMLVLNALVAFMLNVASVMLIGKTSSLVLTLSGILKNILLIVVAVLFYAEKVSLMQFVGYSIALGALTYYSLGWDVIKSRSVAAADWTRAMFSSSGDAGLSPAVRRALILGVVMLLLVLVTFGMFYDGTYSLKETIVGRR
ncbi:hypothetical protein MCOR07_009041 [Pyricularia oryzae]|uniref:Sugar phosphate transporter domain-containing protein n=1 Tax=Pyricularia oryzae (strain 70-15 / ATCC MYA-4617 / FGSC 8958) TaxID=242507 RepID=G4NGT7_PYRO7|nr:uncharacterized protein MGG_04030 [Pyricularia oryzae 70-15]KAH8845950.1 hypothetical protein MCOR01_003170 [Pyricularia oryzae]EHA47447.1 hypothetical protein MGG_04030 [Pyricularia oryzae 70-15]KAI6276880.1 hypothetical protein MCOR26_005373 [Pyricularia oryzae]KAI6333768.1 hypothetical protein MCOR30_004222 [Pyricularia oryzae]KAI6350282.1 hypothetical protein MCOR28_000196 [Pyricularia oryzae]